jgi:hypothetical protein
MVSPEYIRGLTDNCAWYESHGADIHGYLGVGMLYYTLPYILRGHKCVCLGSGGGFVPRLMVEAQRALVKQGLLDKVDVTLIDAGDGGTSHEHPKWQADLWEKYPEIRLIEGLTDDVADQVEDIRYLHVDADHSYEHVITDLRNYGSKMVGMPWAITVHDTFQRSASIGAWRAVKDYALEREVGYVNFSIACGTALIMQQVGA